jgi:MFS family permease
MALHAIADLEDAVDATKEYLFPFDRATWLRLAVVMFFIGGGGAGGFNFFNFPTGGGSDTPTQEPTIEPELTGQLIALVVAVVLFFLLLGLLYALASAVMEFVFVTALDEDEVRLREPFKEYFWEGARLFGFRLVLGLGMLVVVAGLGLLVGVAFGGWPPASWSPEAFLGAFLLALPVFVMGAIVTGIVGGFTNMFVVPVMLLEDRGIVAGWRRFWPTLRAEWKDYLVYLVVSYVLGGIVSFASVLLVLLVALVVAIPFLVVGVILFVLLQFVGIGGLAVVVLAILYVIVMFVIGLVVQVPIQTFLRYYALLVLGDTNEEFDVIPGMRASIRSEETSE